MPNWLIPTLLAIAVGAGVAAQQAVNADLRHALNSATWAGFLSFVVGTICMFALVVAVRDPFPSPATLARLPWYAWTGGLLGAVYIGLAIVLVPQLGTTTFTALIITGQLAAALAFDHFGLLGLAQRQADPARLLGVALLLAGLLLIRR